MGKWMTAGLLLSALTGCGVPQPKIIPLASMDEEQASIEATMGRANTAVTQLPGECDFK
ncbi:hypothetical protein RBSH_00111 [Rhodopirellula baltica SH28]|uniref:Uncharacterized protein n=3 Tax=Rhodopirellula baltica TaxID=265606 RepID=F2B289_RHOBT|nr:hypothetical protein RBWH47_03224 [Rhodopirellula baltica WH47]EKK04496.1 hypothetical protein RBSH_00111 [Rhodopirellula baltica SH28]ELP33664.1 hypothetical protein RBSWK_02407 [Rhodopirellula baltica SWK14]